MTKAPSATAEKRIVQVPLDATELAMLMAFAGIGASVVNALQHESLGDLTTAARAEAAAKSTIEYACQAFDTHLFEWARWRAMNRRVAALAVSAFPESPVVWHGDARPSDGPRPGE